MPRAPPGWAAKVQVMTYLAPGCCVKVQVIPLVGRRSHIYAHDDERRTAIPMQGFIMYSSAVENYRVGLGCF